MNNPLGLPRRLIIFAIILPIAAVLGYQLADPDLGSYAFFGFLLAVLLIPVFLRWHHALLIFSWNAALQFFFLPGHPDGWILLSGVSLGISILSRLILKKDTQTYVPSVVWPLMFLTAVVLITAKLTGGIGLRTLGGSSYGGRRYVYLIAAVLGYFALSGQRIPSIKVNRYMGIFLLSSITYILGHVLYALGPTFWFLYAVFPASAAEFQAQGEFAGFGLVRLPGFTFAGVGISQFMLFRFGLRGLLNVEKPWRLLGFMTALFLTLLGGFRSGLLTVATLAVVLFFLEGLHRTRLCLLMVIGMIVGYATLAVTATKLPMAVQRAVAFLPIHVSPIARADAAASTEWRIKMWQVLWPEVPKHLLLGKGNSIDANDLYLAAQAMRRGHAEQYENALVAGDYHNAPLTLVIQFGLWGVLGFVWFCIASLHYLYKTHRDSPPELKLCNTFLLAFFVTQVVCFFTILGSFAEHFCLFTGAIGLSISLNGRASARVASEPERARVTAAVPARSLGAPAV